MKNRTNGSVNMHYLSLDVVEFVFLMYKPTVLIQSVMTNWSWVCMYIKDYIHFKISWKIELTPRSILLRSVEKVAVFFPQLFCMNFFENVWTY